MNEPEDDDEPDDDYESRHPEDAAYDAAERKWELDTGR